MKSGQQPLKSGLPRTPEDEFLDSLNGYTYEYKPEIQQQLDLPSERQYGVMAQDVESTPLGATFVHDTPHGKVLDTKQGFGSTLAGMGRLNERLKTLEEQVARSQGGGKLRGMADGLTSEQASSRGTERRWGGTVNLPKGSGSSPKLNYETKLSPEDERAFALWKARYAPDDSGVDYDLRGAFKSGLEPDPGTGHWPDAFKKPNHPTFSVESQYAGAAPERAGRWAGRDRESYVPAWRARAADAQARHLADEYQREDDKTLSTLRGRAAPADPVTGKLRYR